MEHSGETGAPRVWGGGECMTETVIIKVIKNEKFEIRICG